MTPLNGPGQVTLLPSQLGRLAELYQDGGAVAISQNGSTVTAHNGELRVQLNAAGECLDNPDQEQFPLC